MNCTRKEKNRLPEISAEMFLAFEELHVTVGTMHRATHLLMEALADAAEHGRMRDWTGEEVGNTLNAVRLLVEIGVEAERLLLPKIQDEDLELRLMS